MSSTAGMDLTDERVVHVCDCGWMGRWDESFAHVVADESGACRIVRDYLPEAHQYRRFDVEDPIGDERDDRGEK